MNTLKEIGNFVGIPQGSAEVAGYGGPRWTQLRLVSFLVTGSERPASMRAIIKRLQNLTPVTLEAQIIGKRSNEEPFHPIIRLNASGGIICRTFIEYYLNGKLWMGSDNLKNSSGDFDFAPLVLGAGSWTLIVKRCGIDNSGFVSLSKTLDTIHVSASEPKPKPTPSTPIIGAELSLSGSGGFPNLSIGGSGFLAGEQVEITKTTTSSDGIKSTSTTDSDITKADGLGRINYSVGVACPIGIRTTFGVSARGLSSGRRSNTAGASC